MPNPVRDTSPADSASSTVRTGHQRLAMVIEAMSEEQVALLAEDLVELLVQRAAGHPSQVASGPP